MAAGAILGAATAEAMFPERFATQTCLKHIVAANVPGQARVDLAFWCLAMVDRESKSGSLCGAIDAVRAIPEMDLAAGRIPLSAFVPYFPQDKADLDLGYEPGPGM